MPMKFKPSQSLRSKASGKTTIQHFYMKSTPLKDLTEALENRNTTSKRKQKIRNELVRRGT